MAVDVSAYWILLPQFGISMVSWTQLILAMNQYHGVCRFSPVDLWSLLLFCLASVVRWTASLAIRTSSLEFQLLLAFLATALGWVGFVVVFNKDFVLPTVQQSWALGMSLAVTTLWEVNNRLVVTLPV